MSTSESWDPAVDHPPECYACGERGLGLRIWVDGDVARGEVTLTERHAGSPNHAHGGVVATLLDDVLGTVSMMRNVPAVTGTLEIRYRAPAYLGLTYGLSAHLVAAEGRRLLVAGEMTGPDGLVAEATGTWVAVELDHFRGHDGRA